MRELTAEKIKKSLTAIPLLSIITMMAGLLFSRAALSIGMISMTVYAVFLDDIKENWKTFSRDRILIGLTLIFFIFFLSGINSSNTFYWADRLRVKLPFLFLPFAFTCVKNKITRKQYRGLLYLFFLMVGFSAIWSAAQYYSNYDTMNELYSHGAVVVTPIFHIRYSLMAAFAVFIGLELVIERFYFRWKWERWLIIVLSLYLIFYLHLIAVRSGLVAFYGCILYLIIFFIFNKRRLKAALLLASLAVLLPVLAYLLLPTVRGKISYMQYDYSQLFEQGNAADLSDASRILSLKAGWELSQSHWLTGVGIGDLADSMRVKLKAAPEHPDDTLIPLNEFLVFWSGTGIFGMIAFAIILFLPLSNRNDRHNLLTVLFMVISFFAIFTDCAIEDQTGTAFFILFILLLHQYNQRLS